MRMRPKVHYTMGVIQIDKFAWVLSTDQQPLEGLSAAGEVTGGIHGACRLGSCAITECLVFGRIAGRTAGSMNTN
jgi:succinate dehydrogenase/fumarate reductase flavoprotein subunit